MRTSFHTVFMLLYTVLLILMSLPAVAGVKNTESGFPIEVEDAYPIKYRELEFEIAARYEDPEEGGGRFVFFPEFKAGAFRNGQVWIAGEFLTDTDDEENAGEFGILYNFNTETIKTPAFSISPRVETSFDGSVDLAVRGIITRSAGTSRFNLNADYIDVGDPEPGERSSGYFIGLGWDRNMNLDTLLLADVFTQRSRFEGEDNETMAELGLRYQYDPETVLAAGIGIGLSGGADSRNFTATVGYQRSF